MITISCGCPFHDQYKLEVFKVWTDDNDIVLFITCDSIKRELGITIKADGTIRNCEVIGVDTLFNKLEEIDSPLAAAMTETVDYQREVIEIGKYSIEAYYYEAETGYMIPLSNVIRLCKPIPNYVKQRLLKVCQYSLCETPLLTLKDSSSILSRFGNNKQPTKAKTNKGFAA